MTFSFGHSEHERIEVDVLGYERAPTGEYWDDNWLSVEIRVRVGGFRGKVAASILTGELPEFLSELYPLHKTLKGKAEFSTLETQLRLRLAGDGIGHIELDGELIDRPGMGNRLLFNFQFDQTELKSSIREIESVVSLFPIRSA